MSKKNIQFRNPAEIMKLSRLGSFHQSKLSFLRSFIREFKGYTLTQHGGVLEPKPPRFRVNIESRRMIHPKNNIKIEGVEKD